MGAAPIIFRDNISVSTIPALAHARRHLDKIGRKDISLVITGDLRKSADFIKALAMGADAIAVSNAAMQAIGCIAMRACHTNNCPVGIASQRPELTSRIIVENSAKQLANFFGASVELMQVMACACGHDHLSKFNAEDLTTWKREMAELSDVAFGGTSPT
jgi:glutamate synthase domain-containing protein 2